MNSDNTPLPSSTKSQSEIDQQNLPTWFMPDYPPLKSSDDVGKAAINEQVFTFPQVVRKNADPPISSQHYGNVSFMLFKQPRIYRDKPIYGYMKLRGNHESEVTARHDAYRLVREVDSKFQVRIAPVGAWVPITESDVVVKELYDVRESDQEIHLRDEAVKEKEEYAKKIATEIRDAEERLKNGPDIYDDCESLDFYAMKRVTEMRLTEAYHASLRKIEELENKVGEQRIILKTLEKNHPNYKGEWVDVYNRERSKTSLPQFIPGETQFNEYDNITLEDLVSKFPFPSPNAFGQTTSKGDSGIDPRSTIPPVKYEDTDNDNISYKSTAKSLAKK